MGVHLTKDSIDLGIVVSDPQRSLAFYRDTLGFTDAGDSPMPGGARMYRLMCGESMVKLVHYDGRDLPSPAPGGIHKGLGYRYWTVSVDNIREVVAACEAAGHKIAVPVTEIGPGIVIAMIEDPDGNWVELLSQS